jgi:O-Antigen ligase
MCELRLLLVDVPGDTTELRRVGLPGGNINQFAGLMLAAAGIALCVAVYQERVRLRVVWWATLPVLAAAVVLSYSRDAFVGAGAMVLACVLVSRGFKLRLAGATAIAGAALVAFTGLGPRLGLSAYISRLSGIQGLSYGSTAGRNVLWSLGWNAFRSHPWFGLGIGNFSTPQYFYRFFDQQHLPTSQVVYPEAVHSLYIGWASDAGLAALIFLIPAISLACFYAARSAWISPSGSELSALPQGLFLAYVGYFVCQAATPTQQDQEPYIMLALAGCLWVIVKGDAKMPSDHAPGTVRAAGRGRNRWQLEGVAAAGILAFALLTLGGGLAVAAHIRLSHSASIAAPLPFVPCGPAARSGCLPPSRSPTVASALVFDSNILPAKLKRDEARAHVGYVWGASAPEQPGGPARHDALLLWSEGVCPGTPSKSRTCPGGGPPSLPWLTARHPDWILWNGSKRGIPARPAGSELQPAVDFTNAAVRRYWLTHYIAPYLKSGFAGIRWTISLAYPPVANNSNGAIGHYNMRHRFVRQYSGNANDIRWVRAQARSLADLLRRARVIDPRAQFALDDPVDRSYAPMASWLLSLHHVHTIFDWQGYSNWGNPSPENFIPNTPGRYCANRWLFKTDFYLRAQRAGKQLVLVNLEPYYVRAFMTDSNPRARADFEWALANYLLVKYSHTYFWFGSERQYGYPVVKQREEMAHLGRPIGDMHPYQGVYIRRFSEGAALVNPSPAEPFTVTLHRGEYEDLYGQRVNRVTMPPHSGLVLVTTKSGKQSRLTH